jgi:hypothetical protein
VQVKTELVFFAEAVVDLDAGDVHLLVVRVDLLPVIHRQIVGGQRDELLDGQRDGIH